MVAYNPARKVRTYDALGHTGHYRTKDRVGTSDHLNVKREKKADAIKAVKAWMQKHPPAMGHHDSKAWITLIDKRGYRIGTWEAVSGIWRPIGGSPNPHLKGAKNPKTTGAGTMAHRKKRKARRNAKKPRTAAQKAATKRMLAANKAKREGKKRKGTAIKPKKRRKKAKKVTVRGVRGASPSARATYYERELRACQGGMAYKTGVIKKMMKDIRALKGGAEYKNKIIASLQKKVRAWKGGASYKSGIIAACQRERKKLQTQLKGAKTRAKNLRKKVTKAKKATKRAKKATKKAKKATKKAKRKAAPKRKAAKRRAAPKRKAAKRKAPKRKAAKRKAPKRKAAKRAAPRKAPKRKAKKRKRQTPSQLASKAGCAWARVRWPEAKCPPGTPLTGSGGAAQLAKFRHGTLRGNPANVAKIASLGSGSGGSGVSMNPRRAKKNPRRLPKIGL